MFVFLLAIAIHSHYFSLSHSAHSLKKKKKREFLVKNNFTDCFVSLSFPTLMGKKKNILVLFIVIVILFTGFSSVSAAPPKILNGVFSKVFSTLLKWLLSLIGSTKSAISSRPVMKYEDGYIVETVFDGSKLGIEPYSVEVLPNGEIMILDSVNSNIYKVSSPLSRYSRPKLVAGSSEGYSGHVDGKLREARMNHPKGFTVDDRGNIYIADAMNMAIRKISEAGVTTIAGGKWGRRGRIDGRSEDATFSNDFDVVYVGSSCSLLVVDRGKQAIREIQLQYDDCAYQNDVGFPLGMVVLVAAGFFGYMLALLQRRASRVVSSGNNMPARKQYISPYQQPVKSSVRSPLFPSEHEQGKQEGFFVSLGRLVLNTGAVKFVGGLFGFKQKPLGLQVPHQYRQQRRFPNDWPLQDSFVIPDEDEPPSLETTTPTPKKTYAFMAKDPAKTHPVRQSRALFNGWDGDLQKERQQKPQHNQQHHSPGTKTFYEKLCETTDEVALGARQKQGEQHKPVSKPSDHADSAYNPQDLQS